MGLEFKGWGITHRPPLMEACSEAASQGRNICLLLRPHNTLNCSQKAVVLHKDQGHTTLRNSTSRVNIYLTTSLESTGLLHFIGNWTPSF